MSIIEREEVDLEEIETLAEPFDVKEISREDQIILGAIEFYEKGGKFRRGWGSPATHDACILGAVIVSKYGEDSKQSLMRREKFVPIRVARRIYRAMFGSDVHNHPDRNRRMMSEIISRNDGYGSKESTLAVLRRALLNK